MQVPDKPRVLSRGPTEISVVNIGGTTIHSGLEIKPGTKLLGLNDKSETALRNRLSGMKLLIIDELSMVSSDLWTDIESRLGEIFMLIPEKAFAGLSVMAVAEWLQLPPVREKPIFSQFSDKDSIKHLLILQLWHFFKYAELTEVVRQNDKLFIDLLNKVRIGNIDDDVDNLLKARFIHESHENYPKDALHMYAEKDPTMKRNEAVLNHLPQYLLELIQVAQNQKQTITGGLAKLLKLEIDKKVMLRVNIDVQDYLINGQIGIIRLIELAEGSARKYI